MASAWHTAALMRAKKIPDLDKFLNTPAAPKIRGKAKPWEQQLAAWGRFTDRGA